MTMHSLFFVNTARAFPSLTDQNFLFKTWGWWKPPRGFRVGDTWCLGVQFPAHLLSHRWSPRKDSWCFQTFERHLKNKKLLHQLMDRSTCQHSCFSPLPSSWPELEHPRAVLPCRGVVSSTSKAAYLAPPGPCLWLSKASVSGKLQRWCGRPFRCSPTPLWPQKWGVGRMSGFLYAVSVRMEPFFWRNKNSANLYWYDRHFLTLHMLCFGFYLLEKWGKNKNCIP